MKYFILGKNASVFHDSTSGLTVTSSDPKNPVGYKGSISKRTVIALKHGHIIEVEAPENNESSSPKTLDEMNDKELTAYYKANFDVSADDLKTFKTMSTEDKVKFLKEE